MSRYTEGLNPGASLEGPAQNPSAEARATAERREAVERYVAAAAGLAGLAPEHLAPEIAPENNGEKQ